jgi:hypothetical protein
LFPDPRREIRAPLFVEIGVSAISRPGVEEGAVFVAVRVRRICAISELAARYNDDPIPKCPALCYVETDLWWIGRQGLQWSTVVRA